MTTPTVASGASFTPINRIAGNFANVVDPVLQAFYPDRDFTAGDITISRDVWPKRTPAQSKDKPDSNTGNQSQGHRSLSYRTIKAKQGPSGTHTQDLVSQQPEISHRSCDPGIPPMPHSGPGQSQAEKSGPKVPKDFATTESSSESACDASAEAIQTFNSHFTIQKRPRTVGNLPSVKRNASTVVLPSVHTSLPAGIGAQASKLLKRGLKREADCIRSPIADPSSNDAIPRKTPRRLGAKVQPNVHQQDPLVADPDALSAMSDDEFKPPSSRKIASGLAPVKRVWKKSEKPLEKSAASHDKEDSS